VSTCPCLCSCLMVSESQTRCLFQSISLTHASFYHSFSNFACKTTKWCWMLILCNCFWLVFCIWPFHKQNILISSNYDFGNRQGKNTFQLKLMRSTIKIYQQLLKSFWKFEVSLMNIWFSSVFFSNVMEIRNGYYFLVTNTCA